MSEPLSIFNVGQHAEELNAAMFAPRAQSNLFDPRVKQAGEQLVFVIRPLPYVNDVSKSMVSKNFYALDDGAGTFFFDSMTTFNNKATKHYEFCPVSDMWSKLNASSVPAVKDLAGAFRMQRASYCYIMVVAYPADPTMVGKVMPMRIPNELSQFFSKMANPTEQDVALGAKPVNPFDIIGGYNIKVTATGKMVNNQLMRDWAVERHGDASPAVFPLGANNAWLPVTQLSQDAVVNFFKETQTEDLEQVYGYHKPSIEAEKRMFNYMYMKVGHLPGMPEVINGYFPDVIASLQAENGSQQAAQSIPVQGVNPIEQAISGSQPAQTAQPAQQAPEQPVAPAQPAAQANSGGATGPGIILP